MLVWLYLVIAGLLEIVWAVGLKYTEGFTKLLPSVITVAAMFLSLWFLSLSLKELPMGTAYAIWTGIGTVGAALFGIIFFSEPATLPRLFSLLLIILGIFGLKLVT